MQLSNSPFDFRLGDRDFLQGLRATIARTGEVGDVFPDMVAFNVPLFALKTLWPEEYERALGAGLFPAFCVAEKGWRGRIDNISSSLEQNTLVFEKSYVMECGCMYVVAKAGEGLALCRVLRNAGQIWTSRAELSVQFHSSGGRFVDHYVAAGTETLPPDAFRIVSRREYTSVGLTIPRREMTGLAVLAQGLMEFHGAGQSTASQTEQILDDRTGGPTKAGTVLAREVFAVFQKTVREGRHPFWDRAAEFFER